MHFHKMLKNRTGATMAEYAVIAAVVVIVALVGFTALGTGILGKIQEVATGL